MQVDIHCVNTFVGALHAVALCPSPILAVAPRKGGGFGFADGESRSRLQPPPGCSSEPRRQR